MKTIQIKAVFQVNKYPVVMYTKDKCPYCAYAKKELNENGVFFVERVHFGHDFLITILPLLGIADQPSHRISVNRALLEPTYTD